MLAIILFTSEEIGRLKFLPIYWVSSQAAALCILQGNQSSLLIKAQCGK